MESRYQLRGPNAKQVLGAGLIEINHDALVLMDALMNQPDLVFGLLQQAQTLHGKDFWKLLMQPIFSLERHCNRTPSQILPGGMSLIQFAAWSFDFYHYLSADGLTDGVNPQDPAMGSTYLLNRFFECIPDEQRKNAIEQLETLRNEWKIVPLLELMQGYKDFEQDYLRAFDGPSEYSILIALAIKRIAEIQKSMPVHVLSYMCEQIMWDPLPDFNNRRAPDRVPMVVCDSKEVKLDLTRSQVLRYCYTDEEIAEAHPMIREGMISRVKADLMSVIHNLGRLMITHGGRSSICDISTLISNAGARSNYEFAEHLFVTKCKMFGTFIAHQRKLDAEYRQEGTCKMDMSP